jgi:hypothetical protein
MKTKKGPTRILGLTILILSLTGCGNGTVEPTQTAPPIIVPAETPSPPINNSKLWITKYPENLTSFKLKTSNGITIITDPYLMNEDVQADIVTSSHYDSDHSDFSRISGEYLLLDMNKVGVFNEKEITITGIAGHHNTGDTSTTNVIFTFDMDGIRLAQFASQGEMPTEDMFAQIGKVDILIIQVFTEGYGKLSTKEAANIAQRLQAKIIIPAHGDTSQTDVFASLLGIKSEVIVTGKLMVTKAELEKQQTPRVVVLDVSR